MPSSPALAEPHLVVLTQYFPPEMGAPQVRLSELGAGLGERGWRVTVLTALPNYPTGRVYDGYSPWRTRIEHVGAMRIVRVPLWPSKHGALRRLATYASFSLSAARSGAREIDRPDLLFVESPPIFIGGAARRLARRWRCPYVLNVSDLWPDSLLHVGALSRGFAYRRLRAVEQRLYAGAAAITGQSSEIVAHIETRAPGRPTAVVTNGVDPDRFGPAMKTGRAERLLGDAPGPIFIYAGLFGIAQGLDQLLDLAARIPDDTAGRFVLVGDGPLRGSIERRLATERLDRVRLLPAQPRELVPELLAAADAAVVPLVTHLPGAVPSKIYEAMASRLPILLIAGGEAASRVRDADCGRIAEPGDAVAIRSAFEQLAADPSLREELGKHGRRAAETTYARQRIADGLDDFLRRVLAPTGRLE